MTRDEAIAVLQEEIDGNLELTLREWRERDEQRLFQALRMAIKALMHEIRTETHGVCLISNDDAMGAVQDHFNANGFKGYDDGQKMMDRIKAIPSAEAVPWGVADKIGEDRERLEERVSELEERLEWIPCSERLPSEGEQIIISVCDDGGDTPYWYTAAGWRCEKYWISDNDYVIGVVTAWMPLPKPYREDGE